MPYLVVYREKGVEIKQFENVYQDTWGNLVCINEQFPLSANRGPADAIQDMIVKDWISFRRVT